MLYETGVEYGDYTMNHVLGCAHGCFGGRCLFRGSGTFGDGFRDGSRRFGGSRCCGFI